MECIVCHKKFEQARHLRLHFARTHVDKSKWTSKCPDCGKVYADDEILRRHMKNHEKRKAKVFCPVPNCVRSFGGQAYLNKHMKATHPETLIQEGSDMLEKKGPKKKYCCDEFGCSASFDKHHLLTQHLFVHTSIPPFQCSHCEKRFLNLRHKIRHEKIHAGYQCPQCNEVFPKWSTLVSHKAKVHKKEYKCEECEKVFFTPGRLKEHSYVHAEVRQVFQCPDCERNFTRKNALNKHISVVHEGKKLYKCYIENCGKRYAHCSSLRQHIDKCHVSRAPKAKKTSSCKKTAASRIMGVEIKSVEAAMGVISA